MKKRKNSKLYLWIKDVILKSLVILLVVTAGFYAYGQIYWPGDDPNPVSGVVGMFLGESEAAFTTSTNYAEANDECATHSDPLIFGSHICTPDEMLNSYNHATAQSPINTYADSSTLWVNNGPPAYTANANDCKGWAAIDSPSNNPNYGTIWNFANKSGGLLNCKPDKKWACCK